MSIRVSQGLQQAPQFVGIDNVKIEITGKDVSEVNQPPTIDARLDQIVPFSNNSVNLDGTLIDDGLPNPPGMLESKWGQVSGPDTVVVADHYTVDTEAVFLTK